MWLSSMPSARFSMRSCRLANETFRPALPQFLGQMRADVLVETAEQVIAAINQVHIDAHAVENTGELDRDIAAADDDHRLRQLGQMKGLFRGDGVFDARHIVGQRRAAASGDQHLGCGDRFGFFFTLDLKRMGIEEPRGAMEQVCAGLGEVVGVDPRQAGDLLVLAHQEGRPVEARAVDRPAEAAGELEVAAEGGGVDHQLLGHAAAHHAGAADPVFLGHRDLGPAHGRQPGRPHPAGPRADDEQVVVVVSHRNSPRTLKASDGRRRRDHRSAPRRRGRETGRGRQPR